MTDVLLNITLQLWLHGFPIPINFWRKCGIMWPALVGRVGRSNSNDADDICGGPPEVPATIYVSNVFTLAKGALGVK